MNKPEFPFSLRVAVASLCLSLVCVAHSHAQSSEQAEMSPPTDTPADAKETVTEIDATDSASFNSKDRVVEFRGHVRVTDPRFQLVCDKLIAYLTKPATAATAGGPKPSATPKSSAKPTPAAGAAAPSTGSGSGIDKVIAVGHVIILQKRPPANPGDEEKITVGRGNEATFDNKTGDMTLKGMPSIEQNGNTHVATSPETIMIIHRDSSLDTKGPSRTELIQHKGSTGLELPGVMGAPDSGGKSRGSKTQAQPSPSR